MRLIDRVPYSEQDALKVSWKADPAPTETDWHDRRGVLMHFVDRLDEEALASLRQLLQEPGNDPEGVP